LLVITSYLDNNIFALVDLSPMLVLFVIALDGIIYVCDTEYISVKAGLVLLRCAITQQNKYLY